MDEDLKARMIQYLDSLEDGIGKAVDFTAEQTPQVIEELIQYTLAISCIKAGFGCLAVMAILVAFCIAWRVSSKCDNEGMWSIRAVAGFIGGLLSVMITDVIILNHVSIALKCWLAPRVFVLEYLRDLIN